MKTIVCEKEECCRRAADQIQNLLQKKPTAVLALACGRSMQPLFEELAKRCAAGELSLKEARVFALTEYEDCPKELRCRSELERELLARTDLRPENCCFPEDGDGEAYEARIAAVDGLDLAVLGLGDNGHFGYNELCLPSPGPWGSRPLWRPEKSWCWPLGRRKPSPLSRCSMPGTTALSPRPSCSCR